MIGIVHIEDEVFITNRDNSVAVPVERVTLKPTWDIDRAGSKGKVAVTADAGVLKPGMWLSTYRTITPERGAIIRFPRGHWHLSRPGIAYPGGHELDSGNVAMQQTASGSDIVDDIAGVLLTDSVYTPVGSNIMRDVKFLIQLATAGILGTNLVKNGGFESNLDDWTREESHSGISTGGNWTVTFTEGVQSGQVLLKAGGTTGQWAELLQTVAIPPGTMCLLIAGFVYRSVSFISGTMHYEWLDSAGSSISGVLDVPVFDPYQIWARVWAFVEVPENAVSVRISLRNTLTANTVDNRAVRFDDIQVRTVSMMPLPESRIRLPQSSAAATTRIQTAEGKRIGTDAINADRLNAIGHNAIATDMEGRLTTQPIRTLANATPRYTFGPGEIELVDMVVPEIAAITEKPLNHWQAIKEDFLDANNSIAADSYNNNPNDPFSVANSGIVRSLHPPIMVQDAIDLDALQAVADAARDRYSLSETVTFAIMPLTDINVYDVVEIRDSDMPDINGLWALNSIDASGDYLSVTATRAVSREV